MDPLALKTAFLIGWFGAFFVAERIAAASPSRGGASRLFRNFGLWALTVIASPLIVLPLAAFAAEHALWTRPSWLGGVASVFLSLVLLDLWTYFLHRAYHEAPLLWRLHSVHHFDRHLDASSAVRFHVGETALSAVLRIVPILALAIPFWHVVLFETLLLASAIFHHSNVRLPPRVEASLSRVIVTPSIHWVHHHATPADTNSNYAALLSLWDRLFGTRSATKRASEMEIGVEGVEDRSLLWLILSPFMRIGR